MGRYCRICGYEHLFYHSYDTRVLIKEWGNGEIERVVSVESMFDDPDDAYECARCGSGDVAEKSDEENV